jgi:hypothetical protein
MKKIFVFAVVIMISAMGAKAQSDEFRNEIGVSYGLGISLIGDGIGNGIGAGIFDALTGRKWTNDKQFGSLAVEYFRHLDNPRWAVGGIVTYSQCGEDVEYQNAKEGERIRKYISVMPSVKYYYVDKKSFGLYSKLGVGGMLLNWKSEDTKNGKTDSDSKFYLTCQISLLGLEAGSQNIRGFLEAGAGEQGIVLAGLRCKF